ncbi:hypothetical protein E3O67_11785 [Cryobacterium sp. TMT3-29-2]|nr:hypothetical protein E3O67_11785 [Cryobacterium sp. TMT3-29-2]
MLPRRIEYSCLDPDRRGSAGRRGRSPPLDTPQRHNPPVALNGLRSRTQPIKPVLQTPLESAQYASEQITVFAAQNGITRSMGYTGICWDNAMAESFFATLKTEFYYRRVWPTRARAIRGVADWIEDRYNRRRRHSSIGHVTPVDFEMQYSSQAAEIQLAA